MFFKLVRHHFLRYTFETYTRESITSDFRLSFSEELQYQALYAVKM